MLRDSQTEKEIISSKFSKGHFGGKAGFLRRIGGDDKYI